MVRRRNWNGINRIKIDPAFLLPIGFWRRLGENLHRDLVMRERKDRPMDRTSGGWCCFERRQNPHTAPAAARLLKENASTMPDPKMRLRELLELRAGSFARQSSRFGCATKSSYRTNRAF